VIKKLQYRGGQVKVGCSGTGKKIIEMKNDRIRSLENMYSLTLTVKSNMFQMLKNLLGETGYFKVCKTLLHYNNTYSPSASFSFLPTCLIFLGEYILYKIRILGGLAEGV
jgi:hypothetical protein